MRVALVLPDDAPGATARLAEATAHGLRRAGHVVEPYALERTVAAAFPGHPGAAGEARPLGEAVRAHARFDAVAAFGWRAFYGMFALDAAAHVHVVTEDPQHAARLAPSDVALIERAHRAPEAALVATTEARRTALARALDRDVLLMPIFVDGTAFRPATTPRDGVPFRTLVDGPEGPEALEFALRVADRAKGIEVWYVGSRSELVDRERRALRVVEPVPLEARPHLLRACDAFLVPGCGGGDDLPPLEAMACGLVVVAARETERVDLLRHADNALVVEGGDVEAASSLLERVAGDPDLRARLRAGAARTAQERDAVAWEPVCVDVFLRAVAGARRASADDRRELAATSEQLHGRHGAIARDQVARAASTTRPWHERARSVVRRAVRRTLRPAPLEARREPVESLAAPGEANLAPGEPVVFAGQRAYFRSAYADAVRAGWGFEYPVRLSERGFMDGLPHLVEATGARTCVVFDPWLLAASPAVVGALRAQGVRLVAYSTEPMPHTDGGRIHWDTLRRLDNLRRARDTSFDLWIHYDPSSVGFLRAEGFSPLVVHPLPVSEELFHPEEVARDIDVCFLGWSTPHRETFLSPVEARFRTVHVAHGFFDEEARRLMNRSKVVLNIHCHDYSNFENRCVQALFCGRPLVSEELSGGYLVAGEDYLLARTPKEMLACAREVIDGDGRSRRTRFDRSRFLVSSLRALLSATRQAGEGP